MLFRTDKDQIKIFCISMQRTGTTSIGGFFRDFGFNVSGYSESKKQGWTEKWFKGDYLSIIKDKEFIRTQVFEDDPWWCDDFYKFLFHYFPKSKFILFERNENAWFQSMVKHSGGQTLGYDWIHMHLYQRQQELYDFIETEKIDLETLQRRKNGFSLENKKQHYCNYYRCRNKAVKLFFELNGNDRLFQGNLEDSHKWIELGSFFDIKVPENYSVHLNKS